MDAILYARLSSDPALTALVGTRIFPVIPTTDTQVPFVVYARASTEDVVTLAGPTALKTYTYTVDVWAINADDCQAVLDVITTRLNGWRGGSVQGCFRQDDALTLEELGYHGTQTYRIFAA